ncbi:MAG: hypothetical protein ACT4O1_06275 [Gemmatimonadota bacterium]
MEQRSVRRALIAVVALMSGCAPFVQHGPWVRSGASGGFIVSGSYIDEETAGGNDTNAFGWYTTQARATHFTIGAGLDRSGGERLIVFSLAAGMEFFRSDARTR